MIYRKSGSTVRLERTRGIRTLLHLQERGLAEEAGRSFRCSSSSDGEPPPPASDAAVLEIDAAIAQAQLPIERLTIVAGNARHEYDSRIWTESQVRIHASLARGEHRATMELGGSEWRPELTEVLVQAGDALGRCNGLKARGSVRLAPAVAAQLWPEIVLSTIGSRGAALPMLSQSIHPDFAFDAYGRKIEPFVLSDGSSTSPPERWPNFYRPSYRSRPSRAAFHLRATLPPSADACDHEGVALLAPVSVHQQRLYASVLCRDGSIAMVDAKLEDLRSGGGPEMWLPTGAGTWSGEVLIRR